MRGPQTLLLLMATLLYTITYTQGTANMVADCCLQTSTKRIPSHVVTTYEMQTPDKGCREKAVVFFTNTKPPLKLCAPLGFPWVVRLIKKVDKKKDSGKKEKTDRKQKNPLQHKQRE